MTTLEFTLSQPIKVSVGGEFTEVDTLELHAPPAVEKTLPIRLRTGFMTAVLEKQKAFAEMAGLKPQKSNDDDEDEDEDLEDEEGEQSAKFAGPEIEMLVFSGAVDGEKYLTDFRKLLIADGVCTVGGVKFVKTHWDQVTAYDAMKLMGEYLAHFFVPSWLPNETTRS